MHVWMYGRMHALIFCVVRNREFVFLDKHYVFQRVFNEHMMKPSKASVSYYTIDYRVTGIGNKYHRHKQ